MPFHQVWIGSTEIIESVFGKIKSLERDQSKGGFTILILAIAACVGKLNADIVKTALEQVKTKDIIAWEKENIGETLLSKRRKFLGGWRKNKKNLGHKSEGIYEEEAMGF